MASWCWTCFSARPWKEAAFDLEPRTPSPAGELPFTWTYPEFLSAGDTFWRTVKDGPTWFQSEPSACDWGPLIYLTCLVVASEFFFFQDHLKGSFIQNAQLKNIVFLLLLTATIGFNQALLPLIIVIISVSHSFPSSSCHAAFLNSCPDFFCGSLIKACSIKALIKFLPWANI